MPRLIDAEKLWMVTEGDHEYYERFEIDNAPTVDAVEVVRCKDCKFTNECLLYLGTGNLNGYCMQGERREDG